MYNQQAQQRSQTKKNSDLELINIWLQQIPPIQQYSHLYIAQMFLKFVKKPLEKVTSADVIAFANVRSVNSHNRESHQHKRVETINSLLKFGQQTGILPTTQKKLLLKKKHCLLILQTSKNQLSLNTKLKITALLGKCRKRP